MMELEVKCPKKKCKGFAQASISIDGDGHGDEGNTEGPCDECGSQVAFHYLVEFDGVRLVGDDD